VALAADAAAAELDAARSAYDAAALLDGRSWRRHARHCCTAAVGGGEAERERPPCHAQRHGRPPCAAHWLAAQRSRGSRAGWQCERRAAASACEGCLDAVCARDVVRRQGAGRAASQGAAGESHAPAAQLDFSGGAVFPRSRVARVPRACPPLGAASLRPCRPTTTRTLHAPQRRLVTAAGSMSSISCTAAEDGPVIASGPQRRARGGRHMVERGAHARVRQGGRQATRSR
jgi:hypothetical protein